MKKLILSIAAMLTVLVVSAQQTIQSENVSGFSGVSFSGNIGVELIPSDVNKIDIELNDVEINKFKWSVKNGILTADLSGGMKSKGRAEIKVHYADNLETISLSGSELTSKEPLRADMMRISTSGGAKLTVELDIFDLELNVTGNSAALLNGTVEYLTLHTTEKSKVDARELSCTSVDVNAATGAEAWVNVDERLVANAKTAATVFYKGKPRIVKDKTSRMNSGVMGSSVLNIGD